MIVALLICQGDENRDQDRAEDVCHGIFYKPPKVRILRDTFFTIKSYVIVRLFLRVIITLLFLTNGTFESMFCNLYYININLTIQTYLTKTYVRVS